MRFEFTEGQKRFRQEVRTFLQQELDRGTFSVGLNSFVEACSKPFSQKMAAKGWIGMTWPTAYGGQGKTYVERSILMEELMRVQAPISFHFMGDRQVGPALIHFGKDEQKKAYLPRIVSAEISFCLCFSEPDAGSDLAAVRTTALEKEDCYLLNGQKVWTSGAHNADYGWVLARTNRDPSVPKHKALSEFIVDLKTPGVFIRPIINMAGIHSFNEIFIQDVRVSKECLVGEKDHGFYQIMAQVDYERAGIERLMQNYPIYEYVLRYVKETKRDGRNLWHDPVVRNRLADLEITFQIGRLLCYWVAWTMDQGKIPNYEAAVCKVFCTGYEQRLTDVSTQILGPQAQLLPGSKVAPYNGAVCESFLWSPSFTIQGGADEILKGIIATRGLGLKTR